MDCSQAMMGAAGARHAVAVRQGRACFHRGDSSRLPRPDAGFDAALCVNTLYFWEAPQRDLAELVRVLRPGGRLCLAFGDAGFMRGLAFAAHGFRLHTLEAEHRTHHERAAGNEGGVYDKQFHLLLARRR